MSVPHAQSRRSFLGRLAGLASVGSMVPELTSRAVVVAMARAESDAAPAPGRPVVAPFHIAIPEPVLADLRDRLARTRWPDASPADGWAQGTNLAYLRGLTEYWRTGFDWRKHEQRLNALPQFQAEVAGHRLHFVHVRGRGPKPLPLILTHGWPSSFAEFEKIIPLLTDPAAHGGDAADAFDVVAPSLPGYGFSARPAEPGMTTTVIAALWSQLMTRHLGYARFCAHGGDIGAGVTNRLGLYHAEVLHGIHVMAALPPWLGPGAAPQSPAEWSYRAVLEAWEQDEEAYGHLQRTRPQTIAYGMHDSPAALAAWIVEKLRSWSDCGGDIGNRFTPDQLLTGLTIYWATETFGSSVRLYYDGARFSPPIGPDDRIRVPAAIALTTEAVNRVPRERAERSYTNIRQWTEFPRGGHFMAHEEPALLADDLRDFFRRFRS